VILQQFVLVGVATAMSVQAVGKEPFAVMGIGSLKCVALVNSKKLGPNALSSSAFAWVQGWFSALNIGTHSDKPLTVGGSLPAAALEAMLISDCTDRLDSEIWEVGNDLYERLAKKGL
jgi:hypothetical protein